MTTRRLFSTNEAVAFGWGETKRYFLSLFLPLGVLTLFLGALEAGARRDAHGGILLLLQAIGMVVTMGWWRIALRVHDGKLVALGALGDVTFVSVLYYLLTLLCFWAAVFVGLVLFVVPGVIVAARLALAPAIVVDEGLEPIAALEKSWALTEGHVPRLLVLGLALAGLNLLGALALGLGLLVSMPTSFLAAVYVYRALAAGRPHDLGRAPPPVALTPHAA